MATSSSDPIHYMFDEVMRDLNVFYLYAVDDMDPANKTRLLNLMESANSMLLFLNKDFEGLWRKSLPKPLIGPQYARKVFNPEEENESEDDNENNESPSQEPIHHDWSHMCRIRGFGMPMESTVVTISNNSSDPDENSPPDLPGFQAIPSSPIITSSSMNRCDGCSSIYDNWGLTRCSDCNDRTTLSYAVPSYFE
jgi:hypothetical protein